MAKTIPDELFEIAKEYSCNTINYVTTTKEEGDVFSLCSTDDNGNYLPIGLPILYSVKGSTIKAIDEILALKILSKIE